MIWLVRLFLTALLVAPFIGASASGMEVAQAANGGLGSGEIALVIKAVLLAAASTMVELVICMAALSIILTDRNAVQSLLSLVIVLSLTFLIPAPLRARAFAGFWNYVGFGAGDALWFLWSATYNTVFFWAVAVAFTQSDRFRSTLFAISELSTGWKAAHTVTRAFAPALAAAAVASFVVSLMSGRELNLLTRDRYPLGATFTNLIGGRDQAAALLCLVLMAILLLLMLAVSFVIVSGPTFSFRSGEKKL